MQDLQDYRTFVGTHCRLSKIVFRAVTVLDDRLHHHQRFIHHNIMNNNYDVVSVCLFVCCCCKYTFMNDNILDVNSNSNSNSTA